MTTSFTSPRAGFVEVAKKSAAGNSPPPPPRPFRPEGPYADSGRILVAAPLTPPLPAAPATFDSSRAPSRGRVTACVRACGHGGAGGGGACCCLGHAHVRPAGDTAAVCGGRSEGDCGEASGGESWCRSLERAAREHGEAALRSLGGWRAATPPLRLLRAPLH